MKNFIKLLEDLNLRYRLLLVVVIGIIVPSVISCRPSRELSTIITRDTLQRHVISEIKVHKIPASIAHMKLPVATLRGAYNTIFYSEKAGQATASVRITNDTIFITAHCDSLAASAQRYYEETINLRSQIEESTKELELTWVEKTWIKIGKVAIILLLLFVSYKIIKSKYKVWLQGLLKLLK